MGDHLLPYSQILHISLGRNLILTSNIGYTYHGYFTKPDVENLSPSKNISTPGKVEIQGTGFTLNEIIESW